MNKILVSGLAIGNDPKIDTCQSCNYDLTWLFKNPSTLLWSDKIIITPEILDQIKKSHYTGFNKNNDAKIGQAINLIFEGLDKNGLLEIKKPSEIITEEIKRKIYIQMIIDQKELLMQFPDDVREGKDNVPGQLFVSEHEYCTPSLWTHYASLLLAKEWKSNLFLPQNAQNYFEKLFLLKNKQITHTEEQAKAFEEIFRNQLPEFELFPIILFDAKLCQKCATFDKCDTDVFSKVEDNINLALEWRTYDEIYQLKEVLSKITQYVENNPEAKTKDIIRAYKEEETKIRKKINSVFPKVQRWSNMVTMISLPIVVAGVSASLPAATVLGVTTASLAKAVDLYIEVFKNKNRWIGHKITK